MPIQKTTIARQPPRETTSWSPFPRPAAATSTGWDATTTNHPNSLHIQLRQLFDTTTTTNKRRRPTIYEGRCCAVPNVFSPMNLNSYKDHIIQYLGVSEICRSVKESSTSTTKPEHHQHDVARGILKFQCKGNSMLRHALFINVCHLMHKSWARKVFCFSVKWIKISKQ